MYQRDPNKGFYLRKNILKVRVTPHIGMYTGIIEEETTTGHNELTLSLNNMKIKEYLNISFRYSVIGPILQITLKQK